MSKTSQASDYSDDAVGIQKNHDSDNDNDDSDSDDDIISIQLKSNIIEISFKLLTTYSETIRKKCDINNAEEFITKNLENYENNYGVEEKNIILFFKLIQEEKTTTIQPDDFWDLNLLSTFFKVKKFKKKLKKYSQHHSNDISFICGLILKQSSPHFSFFFGDIDDSTTEFENILKENVESCLKSEQFGRLPISHISRIIEGSKNEFSSDSLYDFIYQSIEIRCDLFRFLDVSKLSDVRFNDLYRNYNQEPRPDYFIMLPADINYIYTLRNNDENNKGQIDQLIRENIKLRDENKRLKNHRNKLKEKDQLVTIESLTKELKLVKTYQSIQEAALLDENKKLIEENKKIQNEIDELNKKLQKNIKELSKAKQESKQLSKWNRRNSINYTNIVLLLAKSVKKGEIEKEKLVLFSKNFHNEILHRACYTGNLNIVKYFIENFNEDINVKNVF